MIFPSEWEKIFRSTKTSQFFMLTSQFLESFSCNFLVMPHDFRWGLKAPDRDFITFFWSSSSDLARSSHSFEWSNLHLVVSPRKKKWTVIKRASWGHQNHLQPDGLDHDIWNHTTGHQSGSIGYVAHYFCVWLVNNIWLLHVYLNMLVVDNKTG